MKTRMNELSTFLVPIDPLFIVLLIAILVAIFFVIKKIADFYFSKIEDVEPDDLEEWI